LILLGIVAITITVLSPQGIWGWVTKVRPMALFGIQRRLVLGRTGPSAAPPANDA